MTDSQPVQQTLAGAERPKTKYTFVSTETGCLIQREGGYECAVEYKDTYLYINGQPCGVYDEHRAEQLVAETFTDWVSPRDSRRDREECVEMIQRALHSRFFAQWKRLVSYIVPEDVEELSRKMFNSVVGDAAILHILALYADDYKHLRADLKKYAACRMFAKHLEEGWLKDLTRSDPPYLAILPDKKLGGDPRELLDMAANWRQRLTPAVPYKALNKTLDSIAWGISWKHLHRLSTMRLDNPITTRLHLAFALASSEHHNWGLHERIVLSANDKAVIEAGAVMGWEINLRTRKDMLERLGSRILDYPEPYGGDLVGLARRSHQWHDEQMAHRLQRIDADFLLPDGTYRPSWQLPAETELPLLDIDYERLAEDGIVPLRTAGDCYHEHEVMGHCVHTYATKAQKGLCYLFHVEHNFKDKDGNVQHEQATIELLPTGEIGQAEGPDFDTNEACKFAIGKIRSAWMGRK